MGNEKCLKPAERPFFKSAHASHQGYVRLNNEDRLVVREFIVEEQELPLLAAVLCDGVGGHNAGEVAAQIGVDTVLDCIANCDSLEDPARLLEDALMAANQAVLAHSQIHPDTIGMGATCVSALIAGNRLYIANLGDSRAYLLRREGLKQITQDHTWLADNPDADLPEFTQLGRHNPLAHVLNRYLGCRHPMKVDLCLRLHPGEGGSDGRANQGMELAVGDRLLLCSDGLTDMLDDRQLEKLAARGTLEIAGNKLLEHALNAGGHDNVSLILVEQSISPASI